MRVKEFVNEINLNIPDQMVTVQVPLSAITGSGDTTAPVKNPGTRMGKNGKKKWSPPLQQHLDTVKDTVGPSDDEIGQEAPANYVGDPKKKIAAVTQKPSVLG